MTTGTATNDTGTAFATSVQQYSSDPYVWGGDGPASFDCSGLVQYALSQIGISAPRTSEEQWAWVQHIPASQVQPGDLVFAQFPGDTASPGHVGVYIGNGQVFSAQSPSAGIGPSTISSWGSAIVGYGRVPGLSTAGTGSASGGTTTTSASSACPSVTLNPMTWLNIPSTAACQASSSIVSFVETDIVDWAERLGLIVFGAILIIMGTLRISETHSKQMPDQSAPAKSSAVSEVSEVAA